MKRKLYNDLLKWKKNEERKPLLLRGARQVGKTYLLNEFGKQEFSQLVYINFEKHPLLGKTFDLDLSPKRIISVLEVEFKLKIVPGTTLIFFDEIQECPKALTSLKYFCEDAPLYHIVGAGSLLGIKTLSGSFPVGKVNFLDLFPLTFSEFLLAIGEDQLCSYLSDLEDLKLIPENLHIKCLDILKQYFCIGGMPEAVKTYIEKRDLDLVRSAQIELLQTYSDDFAKHAGKEEAMRIQQVWESIPRQLAREQKKFKLSDVKKGARSVLFQNAIEWLVNADLCHKVQLVKKPEFPLLHFVDPSFFKLLLLDVGLLGAMNQLPPQLLLKENDLFKTFKGAFTESFVGQELKAVDAKHLFYWRSKYESEVDYLIESNSLIYPIEVKSGTSGKLKSLNVYSEKYLPKFKIRISSNNFFQSGNFISIPLYAVEHLSKFISV